MSATAVITPSDLDAAAPLPVSSTEPAIESGPTEARPDEASAEPTAEGEPEGRRVPPHLRPALPRPVVVEPAPTPPPAMPLGPPSSGLALVDGLLRNQRAVIDRIERGEALGDLVRTCVATIGVAAAVLGAAIGADRGGLQIVYAAIKLPLVVLLTAGLTTPALSAIDQALRGRSDLRRDLATVLAALTLASLLMAATAPIVFFAGLVLGYHDLILAVVACCAAGGLGGLVFFGRTLKQRGLRPMTGLVFLGLFAVIGCQMAWTLRPWVVRPQSPDVVFVRGLEGSFFGSVRGSYDSARGVYYRDMAPLPEEAGR